MIIRSKVLFVYHVAAFLAACSDSNFQGGSKSTTNRKKSPPAAQEAQAVPENGTSETSQTAGDSLIIPADPNTREEFVELMNSLAEPQKRQDIRNTENRQLPGIFELASALDNETFVNYVSDINETYEQLTGGSDSARAKLVSLGQEVSGFMQDTYPAAVDMLLDHQERFGSAEAVADQIREVKDLLAGPPSSSTGDEAMLALQEPEEADKSKGGIGGITVKSVVAVAAYANIAGAANVAGATNVAAVTNVVVVAEAVACIVVAVCPAVS